jgi:DNA ligase-1
LLKNLAAKISGLPLWLVEETYHIVGDLAETLALILPQAQGTFNQSLHEVMQFIMHLKSEAEWEKEKQICDYWMLMNKDERFLFNKMITGGFRIGISQALIVKALSIYLKQEVSEISYKLSGDWKAHNTTWSDLFDSTQHEYSKPYPFYLCYALDKNLEELGTSTDWNIEWKWDGIRSQLVYRNKSMYLWSRGEELITDRFPEIIAMKIPPDISFVIDGELLAFKEGKPMAFQIFQTRISRKKVSKNLLQDVPAVVMAYDLLEWQGEDMRSKPHSERRQLLESLIEKISSSTLKVSPLLPNESWSMVSEYYEKSRDYFAEGIMLKNRLSTYKTARKTGDWWKMKINPYTIDAVMIYAQRGHGRRANLYSDFTFAVKNQNEYVAFAKAYSGLTDQELSEINRFIRENTIQRFGPVSTVKPMLVFEIAFEGITISKRHKSGISVRFPRILRWRRDKSVDDVNSLSDLKDLI